MYDRDMFEKEYIKFVTGNGNDEKLQYRLKHYLNSLSLGVKNAKRIKIKLTDEYYVRT